MGASRRLGQAAACPRFLAQGSQRLRAQGWGLKMLSAERLERILGCPCGWRGGPVRCEAPTRNGAQPEALPRWCSPRCQDREHRQGNADPNLCRPSVRFKAARGAARAADTAAARHSRWSSHAGRPPTPVGWREDHDHEGRLGVPQYPSSRASTVGRIWQLSGAGLLPNLHCRGRPEPVKGAFGVGFAADP